MISGAAFFGTLLLFSCAKDQAIPKSDCITTGDSLYCDSTAHTFANDVQPILTNNCALSGCHSSDQDDGGFPLNTHEDAVFAAGFPEFLNSIKHGPDAEPMPDGKPKLCQIDINAIECWVLAGTPDD